MNERTLDDFSDQELFSTGNIFAQRELLRVGHVPESDRIVGRDEEMRQVGQGLAPATEGGPPRNMIIYGKTGTGKSLVSRHVTRRARRQADRNGVDLIHVYIDSSNDDTETRVAREMAMSVRDEVDPSMTIPSTGIGASEYYRYLWNLLEDIDAFIVILDEIDKLRDDDVLMQLSRAEESGKTETYVGVVSVSNKINYRERLNKRIDSSLQDREFTFDPYDANQLREIMYNREDAFRDDVLNQEVIPLTAGIAAQEHGDARKAIDILHEAGSLAEEEGADQVREHHVRDAQHKTEIKRFQELVSGQTPHVKYILEALAHLTLSNSKETFSTHDIYQKYKRVADSNGSDPLSQDRVYRLLDEQAFLGVTESHHTSGGRGQGSYLEHRLMRDPEIVVEAVEQ